MSQPKRIILGVTGSIAAYRSADIVRGFLEKGLRVSVVMTRAAEQFITPLTMSSLSGEQCYTSMFDAGDGSMPHIELARSADALLIAPATADVIGKLANGLADDLLTCIALCTKAPVFIAPAMNTEMYRHPIVQQNCEKLRSLNVTFIDSVEGGLACGTYGYGHIAEKETIVETVAKAIQ
ncbi:MAG: phosphopantothenoylcysteine decarboxylase [Candidatus Omnitrophica bacterium]|nr:phosphopantothenoylcysteine decarboxylase [Candidatus Omnitrophota bacterium]